MRVNNLTEFFAEFKKYRNSKKEIANSKNYYDYVFFTTSRNLIDSYPGYSDIKGIGVNLDKGKILISIDISQIELKDEQWLSYEDKIEKVLKDIWETGEIKNTYGLDLSWPRINNIRETPIADKEKIIAFFATKKPEVSIEKCNQCQKYPLSIIKKEDGTEILRWEVYSDGEGNEYCSKKCLELKGEYQRGYAEASWNLYQLWGEWKRNKTEFTLNKVLDKQNNQAGISKTLQLSSEKNNVYWGLLAGFLLIGLIFAIMLWLQKTRKKKK